MSAKLNTVNPWDSAVYRLLLEHRIEFEWGLL